MGDWVKKLDLEAKSNVDERNKKIGIYAESRDRAPQKLTNGLIFWEKPNKCIFPKKKNHTKSLETIVQKTPTWKIKLYFLFCTSLLLFFFNKQLTKQLLIHHLFLKCRENIIFSLIFNAIKSFTIIFSTEQIDAKHYIRSHPHSPYLTKLCTIFIECLFAHLKEWWKQEKGGNYTSAIWKFLFFIFCSIHSNA